MMRLMLLINVVVIMQMQKQLEVAGGMMMKIVHQPDLVQITNIQVPPLYVILGISLR